MKNKISTLAFTIMMIAASTATFGQNKKTETETQKDLRLAKTDSLEDYKKFKTDAEMRISENDKRIAKLKEKKSDESQEVKDKYNKKIQALEERNNKLKTKVKESENTPTSTWSSFKREFKHDMDELGNAIKDIGVDNKK